jgi:RNA polymerase sigma factor (TIGR02999 family)
VSDDITEVLNAGGELPADLYAVLRRVAQQQLARQRGALTLNATALVNEAWIKLSASDPDPRWDSRQHYLATMARVMRHVLIDAIRQRQADRRGGDWERVTLEGLEHGEDEALEQVDLIAIDQALARLRAFDPRLEQVFELRFFGGCTREEIAAALGISTATVERDLRAARAFVIAQWQGAA